MDDYLGEERALEDQDFNYFIRKVKEVTAIDLSLYKEAQMKRRLTTLRLKRGYHDFQSYFEAMMKDNALFEEFLDRMTINVSEFWRNPTRWQRLKDHFIPELFKSSGRHLKCWSAACSTGEEPYTLAMILMECGALPGSKIIASDLDEGALAKARAGVYPERSVRDVPSSFLSKYLKKDGLTYHIDEKLKQYIKFEKKNLLHDRFEQGFDLIICRNVMIYFTDEAKHQLFHSFSKSLRPGGLLFVGSTEQIFTPKQYGLESADTFFYRKRNGLGT